MTRCAVYGAGDAKGFRRVRPTNREGTHVPSRGTPVQGPGVQKARS